MQIEVINTGSELLLGSTINTHAAWFGRELFSLGLRVSRQVTVPDGDPIRDAIRESLQRADVLLVTGGLGPTSDDLTREITAEVLGIELISDEAAMRSIEGYFAHRGRPMAAANLKQALVPVGADVLPNPNGTAPGVYVPPCLNGHSNCAIFLLPGPPRELYPMYHNEVLPRLRALSGIENPPKLLNLRFTGIGESDFHQQIDEQLSQIEGLEHGYCAHISEVDLRLIGHASALAAASKIATDAFGDQLISSNGDNIAETVVRMLSERKLTLATAESCTGGLIASRITDVPGSSAVFTHGFVTYSNTAKESILGVSHAHLDAFGAVSEAVVKDMAEGALRVSQADLAVAISGIAGPGGGSMNKPVGTAWIALATQTSGSFSQSIYQPRNRHDFKLTASTAALEMVRRHLKSAPLG